LKTYYDKSDLKEEPELGKPGEYPFVRGVYTTMYRGKTMDYEAICWVLEQLK